MPVISKIDEKLINRANEKQLLSAFQLFLNNLDNDQDHEWLERCAEIWEVSCFKLKNLHISEYRGIKNLDLDLDEKLTLIIGENGTGKTTILEAIAKSLSILTSSITSRNFSSSPLKDRDIRQYADFFSIQTILDLGNKNKLRCCLSKARSGSIIDAKNDLYDFKLLGRCIQHLDKQELTDLPVLVYYAISRSEKMKPSEFISINRKKTENRIGDLYDKTNLNGKLNLEEFEQWFIRLSKKTDPVSQDQLKKFKALIVNTVPCVDDICINLKDGIETIEIKIGNNFKNFSYLSDGQRLFVALIVDLARKLTLSSNQSDNPFDGQGIVLIDEIELHLHPQWQRDILPSLLHNFPNIQFIVTTHSPQVISSVDSKSIRTLTLDENEEIIVGNVDYQTDGATSSEVLNRLMNVSLRRKLARPAILLKKLQKLTADITSSNEDVLATYYELVGMNPNDDLLNEAKQAKVSFEIRKKLASE